METSSTAAQELASLFVERLREGDFSGALALGTVDFQARVSLPALESQWTHMIHEEFGPLLAVEVFQIQETWVGKLPQDVAWVYVSLDGDVYSEALVVVISKEAGALGIRAAEFGRP